MKVAAMTERGQLATEAQRNDMDTLVERLEDLKATDQLGPFEDENMVNAPFCCSKFLLCSVVYVGELGGRKSVWTRRGAAGAEWSGGTAYFWRSIGCTICSASITDRPYNQVSIVTGPYLRRKR